MAKQFHFRCTANRSAPILTVNTPWEAKDMRSHPDYEELNELGEVIEQVDEMEGTIPFHGSKGRK